MTAKNFDPIEPAQKTCPKCGNEMVWPVAVYVICGETSYTITSKGCEESLPILSNPARGVIIAREFICENHDCRWREIEEFHKGTVFTSTEIVPLLYGPNSIIWRD